MMLVEDTYFQYERREMVDTTKVVRRGRLKVRSARVGKFIASPTTCDPQPTLQH